MKVLIIEDEAPAAERLTGLLTSIDSTIEVLGVCNSINSSVKWLTENGAPELILMDIELADGKSFEIFNKVTVTSPVIFTTAYDEFAIKAIKLNALDYLLKPINKKDLAEALKKTHKNQSNTGGAELKELQHVITGIANGKRPKKLAISTIESTQFVDLDNIIRLEADSNYTQIYLTDKKQTTTSRTLKDYEEMLCTFGFFRVNKGHIINVKHIDKLMKGDGGYVLMTDGKNIEISSMRKRDLLAAIAIG